jgi:hypothetical protein
MTDYSGIERRIRDRIAEKAAALSRHDYGLPGSIEEYNQKLVSERLNIARNLMEVHAPLDGPNRRAGDTPSKRDSYSFTIEISPDIAVDARVGYEPPRTRYGNQDSVKEYGAIKVWDHPRDEMTVELVDRFTYQGKVAFGPYVVNDGESTRELVGPHAVLDDDRTLALDSDEAEYLIFIVDQSVCDFINRRTRVRGNIANIAVNDDPIIRRVFDSPDRPQQNDPPDPDDYYHA